MKDKGDKANHDRVSVTMRRAAETSAKVPRGSMALATEERKRDDDEVDPVWCDSPVLEAAGSHAHKGCPARSK